MLGAMARLIQYRTGTCRNGVRVMPSREGRFLHHKGHGFTSHSGVGAGRREKATYSRHRFAIRRSTLQGTVGRSTPRCSSRLCGLYKPI